jgi:integrase
MARYWKRSSKNMGFGRSAKHAAKNALRCNYGGGHFETVVAHSQRFNLFCDWMKTQLGETDLRYITQENLVNYGEHLKLLMVLGSISVNTATNRISSCNVIFKIMRGDTKICIVKIGKLLGKKRSYIRKSSPAGMLLSDVELLQQQLEHADLTRVSAIAGLTSACGMRLREAILADLPRLQREARNKGEINIQEGTKGGRRGAFAERWIPATDEVKAAINYAIKVSPKSSRNLLAPYEEYKTFLRGPIEKARREFLGKSIKGFHELRAAYACRRYEQLTGYPASVILKRGFLSNQEKDEDQKARKIISAELGHKRIEITNSYIGSNSI